MKSAVGWFRLINKAKGSAGRARHSLGAVPRSQLPPGQTAMIRREALWSAAAPRRFFAATTKPTRKHAAQVMPRPREGSPRHSVRAAVPALANRGLPIIQDSASLISTLLPNNETLTPREIGIWQKSAGD